MGRKVVVLTIDQKREIYNYKKKYPFSTFPQIAKFWIPPSYANDQEIEDREIEVELETSRESLKSFTLLN